MSKLLPTANDIFRGLRQFSSRHNDFIKQSTLDNGITVSTQPRLLDSNIGFTVHINSGSFEDPEGKEGIAHFLEHILMDYKHWRQLFDQRKGHFGLFTSCEGIKLEGEIPASRENEAFLAAAIADFIHGRGIEEKSFIREKRRILNEIGLYDDDANRRSRTLIGRAFTHNRADSNIGGTREGIRSTTLDDIRTYHETWFKGPNIFIGMTGKIRHDVMRERLQRTLGDVSPEAPPALILSTMTPGDYRQFAPLEQLYFAACFAIPSMPEGKMPVHLLAADYMNDKISKDVVFESGIVYSAYANTYHSPVRPGHFNISANIIPEEAEHIIPELTAVITGAISDFDSSTFDILKSNVIYSFEKQRTLMSTHGSDQLASFPVRMGRIIPTGEYEDMIREVQADDVHRYLVDTVFSGDPAIVTLGDDRRLGSYDDFVGPIRQTLAKMNLPCPK